MHRNKNIGSAISLAYLCLMCCPLICSWYPWGFDSCKFVEVWRYFVEIVRGRTCRTVFMWAPADAGGYPFSGLIALSLQFMLHVLEQLATTCWCDLPHGLDQTWS